jgi:predicted nucleotidyltransferase
MDISSAWFFEMVTQYYKRKGSRLQMFSEQYHEINNRKNKAAWNTPIRKVATKALQRIEEMLDDDVLEILNLDSTSDSNAYADGCFFDEINNNPQNAYTIISRDLDLRIRIKNRYRHVDCKVLNLKDCDYRNI